MPVVRPGSELENPPDQRVTVGVQARGAHGHDDVTVTHALGPQHRVGLHHAGGRPRDVVLVRAQQAGVLGRLAADERHPDGRARLRGAPHDGGDALRDDPAAGDVVGHEQRPRPADDDVVDDHPHQVVPDGVVDVHGLRDGDLGPDAVGAGGQQRTSVRQQRARVEEPGEPTEAAQHLGAVGGGHRCPHQLHGAVARLDVDSGAGVGDRPLARGVRRRHGRPSESVAPPPVPVVTPSTSTWSLPPKPAPSGSCSCESRCLPSCSSSGSGIG